MIAIVCVDKNWGIGKDGDMLFHISADLRRFRELTIGKSVVMGKNTLLSLPGAKPLPKRRNIVVSTTLPPREDCDVVATIDEALALAGEDAMLMGGGQLYRALIDRCSKVYLTLVDAAIEADTFFPDLDANPDWEVAEQSEIMEENGIRFQYVDYVPVTKEEDDDFLTMPAPAEEFAPVDGFSPFSGF